MQEDILGTERAMSPTVMFVTCSRCNRPVPRSQASIVPADTLTENTSDFDYLCRDCQNALADGEIDIATDI